jgi:putative transposase
VKRDVVKYLVSHHGYSERRACRLAKQNRTVQRYQSTRDPRTELRQRMRDIAGTRVRFGYRRIRVMLNREGWGVGKNLVYRLYSEEGLALRKKPPKRRKMAVKREARCVPKRANDVWSLDFVSDELNHGQRFRALTVVDVYTREALAIDVGVRLRGEQVVETLNRLVMQHGKPRFLFADNGAEFTGRLMDMWAYHHGTRIDFSRPGKPTDNAFIESFNGSLRDECLNIHWFESIDHAREVIERWRVDYNESRPHMALGNIPPQAFARRAGNSTDHQDP